MALHLRIRESSYTSRLAVDLMYPVKYIHESLYIWALNILSAASAWGWPLESPLASLIYANVLILLTRRHSSFHHSSHLNCIAVLCGEAAYLTPRWALYLPPQGHLGTFLCRLLSLRENTASKPRTALLASYSVHADRELWDLSYITWLILPLISRSACSWRNVWLFWQRGDGQIIKCSLRPNKQQPQQSSLKKITGKKWSFAENLLGCVCE